MRLWQVLAVLVGVHHVAVTHGAHCRATSYVHCRRSALPKSNDPSGPTMKTRPQLTRQTGSVRSAERNTLRSCKLAPTCCTRIS